METNKKHKQRKVILHYVKQFKLLFIVLLSCVILTTFSGSIYPYIFGLLVDNVFSEKDMTMFITIVLLYAGVFVVNQALHFLLNMSWAKLMVKYIYKIREDMFSIFQNLPCKELADRESGDIIQRINWDSEQFLTFIHKNIFYLIASILELAISLGFIFYLDVWAGLLVVIATPIVVLTSRYFSKKVGKLYSERNKIDAKRNSWLFEAIEHVHELKLLGARNKSLSMYSDQNEEKFDNSIAIAKEEVKTGVINNGVSLIAKLLIFAISMIQIVYGNITIGGVIAILGYFDTCVSSFNSLNKKIVSLRENKAGIDRCIEVLERKTEDYNEGGLKHDIVNPDIRFNNVSFSYDGKVNILENINLDIKAKETIGIVGVSGGGKSTLTNLINRLFLPHQGEIFVDGINVSEYSLHYLRNQIGVVYQENCFFKGSIRFNLIFSEDKSFDEKLLKIIELVNMKEYIDSLPNGLDTIIMDGERKLSGGQKQRLAIARAYIKNPKIMIFDEATSALDSESERIVQNGWNNLFPESTKIVIAHRLSTIMNADRIVVINEHTIEKVGTHDELMKESTQYAALFRQQLTAENSQQ